MTKNGHPLLAFAPPLLAALPGLGWVWAAADRASWASLGRDQGIFQYVAWAVGQGDRAYRDVRDVNGPVIPMVHAAFQSLGGGEEHRFRQLDLLVTIVSFAIAGALVPIKTPRPLVRLAWSAAAAVVLLAQYLVYGYWHTAQRESFLDWFVLVSIALLAAEAPAAAPARGRLLVSGALAFVPWLGKPTYALFTAAELLALAIDSGSWRGRLERIGWFCAGGLIGLAGPLLYILARGDFRAWSQITFVDVPAMYRFIWPRPALSILMLPGYSTTAVLAAVTAAGLGALIAVGRLPRRALPIALMPVLGLVSVIVQAKGFPYHFHPVTLGIAYAWLVALAATWEWASSEPGIVRRGAILAGAVGLGVRAALLARNAPYPPSPPEGARDKAALESPERLAYFDDVDFFPRALRDGAEYVAARTSASDRVQIYGMDAYFLFLAGRRSATPYVYAYDLNVDAALHGSFDPAGPRPDDREVARIRAMQAEHAKDLLERLKRSPPAAFVFIDRSPLMTWQDAVYDFAEHCAETARWVAEHYKQSADFDGVRVWLRDDIAAREAE